jgi:hypothetical protein
MAIKLTKAQCLKAIDAHLDERDHVLRDIGRRIERASEIDSFTHLAHNLASCVNDLSVVQTKIEMLKMITDEITDPVE